MAIAFVNAAAATHTTAAATGAVTATSVIIGNLIIVGIALPATATNVTSVTDNVGTNYVLIGTAANGSTQKFWLYAGIAAGVVTTITGHFSASTRSTLTYGQYSGAMVKVVPNFHTNTGSTSPETNAVTITAANNWVVGIGGVESTATYSASTGNLRTSQVGTASNVGQALVDNTSGSIGSVTVAAALSAATAWSAIAVELVPSSGIITHVANSTSANGSTASVAVTRTATAGNLIIVVSSTAVLNASITGYSISDTQGNVWHNFQPHFVAIAQGGTNTSIAWWAIAKNSSSSVITVTCTGSAVFLDMIYDEFSGTDLLNPVNPWNTATGSAGGTFSVGVQPGYQNCALWGYAASSSFTIGAGYILGFDNSASGGDGTEYAILPGSSGVAQSLTATGGTTTWAMIGAVINPPLIVLSTDLYTDNQLNRDYSFGGIGPSEELAVQPPVVGPSVPNMDWTTDADQQLNRDARSIDHNDDVGTLAWQVAATWNPAQGGVWYEEDQLNTDWRVRDDFRDNVELIQLPLMAWAHEDFNQLNTDTRTRDDSADNPTIPLEKIWNPKVGGWDSDAQYQFSTDTRTRDDSSDNVEFITLPIVAWDDDAHDQLNRDIRSTDHNDDLGTLAWQVIPTWNPALGGTFDDEMNQVNRDLTFAAFDAAAALVSVGVEQITLPPNVWEDTMILQAPGGLPGFNFQGYDYGEIIEIVQAVGPGVANPWVTTWVTVTGTRRGGV